MNKITKRREKPLVHMGAHSGFREQQGEKGQPSGRSGCLTSPFHPELGVENCKLTSLLLRVWASVKLGGGHLLPFSLPESWCI